MNPTFQDFLPQGNEIASLRRQAAEGGMVHALLIVGDAGMGKRTLALLLAQALLCRAEAGEKPCGKCNSCIMTARREHPDLILLEKGVSLSGSAPQSKTQIPVSEIREMIRLCSSYAFEGGNRVVLIFQAEDMNAAAQNALLKILEEPPAHTYFILTSAHPDQLLPTVISRCRSLKMKPWSEAYMVSALKREGVEETKATEAARAAHGAVGTALTLASDEHYWETRREIIRDFFHTRNRSDILKISSRWKDKREDAGLLFDTLESAVRALLALRLGDCGRDALKDFPEKWVDFAATADYDFFSVLLDRIASARKQCAANVNFQAVFEQLLLSLIGSI